MKIHASLLCHGTYFAMKCFAIHCLDDHSGPDQSPCSSGWLWMPREDPVEVASQFLTSRLWLRGFPNLRLWTWTDSAAIRLPNHSSGVHVYFSHAYTNHE